MTTLLSLTPFEEYMWVDETIDHPMTFFLRADFSGRFNLADFEAAFSEVVQRHPILWSTAQRRFPRGLRWKTYPDRMPKLDVRRTTALGECHLDAFIALENEPGVRAQLSIAGDDAELWLQFHHCCMDGIGGIRFLEELFAAYQLRVSGESCSEGTAASPFPAQRCSFQRLSHFASARRLWMDMKRIWSFFGRRLIEIKALGNRQTRRTATPSFLEMRLPFSKEMMSPLKRTQPSPPTVNDVLMRDLFLAVGDWVRSNQSTEDEQWLRLSAAINMRDPNAAAVGCHNDVSMVFLDRRMQHLERPAELLSSITDEMRQVKRDSMGNAFLRGLAWLRAIPGGTTSVQTLRRVFTTAVVSNLGPIFRQSDGSGRIKLGNVTVRKFGFLSPIRKGTPVSFGVLTHGNELTIGMHYDDGVISRHGAQELLERVAIRLCDSLGIERQPDVKRAA